MDELWRDPAISRRPWVVLGCGYTGVRLAGLLVEAGARVIVTRRTADDARAAAQRVDPDGHVTARALDVADAEAVAAWLPAGALVVDSIPPGPASPGADAALARALAAAHRLVYLSSTGVYPRGDGGWMDEDTPADPAGSRGVARLAAEQAVLGAAGEVSLSAVALRIVGIYGPGRGVVARMRAGRYRVIGDGDTYVNRVHVDDLCAAIATVAVAPALARAVYNVADDRPDTSSAYGDAVARAMGVPPPPRVPTSAVDPRVVAMLTANRRISNAAIKRDLGWRPVYPSWRDSLPSLLA